MMNTTVCAMFTKLDGFRIFMSDPSDPKKEVSCSVVKSFSMNAIREPFEGW